MTLKLNMAVFGLAGACLLGAWAQAAQRPNILLIMADDLGYADVGFNGSPDIVTPEMDQLASGGAVFGSAYVVHPFCGPSRMGMMTGRYPHEYGAPFNLPPYSSGHYREHGFPESEPLMSTVLQSAGYFTGLMGKWHLGHAEAFYPTRNGFDEFYGFRGGGILYFGPYVENNAQGKIWDYKIRPEYNGEADFSLTKQDYMTDVLTKKGIRFLNQAAAGQDPFFLFMSYNAPHTMLEATEADLAVFPELTGKRQTYAAMVYAMDRGIGKLVETLKSNGQYDNTLIVFLSDNGGRLDAGANNAPLRGSKGDALEGGYRVPMFMHWPGTVKAGTRYDHPVSALDFYPTFAALAGAKIPQGKQLDGKDMWQALLQGKSARKGEMIYCLRHWNGFSVIGGRRDQWKVLRSKKDAAWELYNVDSDPQESRNLAAEYPERLADMVNEVAKWAKPHPRPLWFDNPARDQSWGDVGLPWYDRLFNQP